MRPHLEPRCLPAQRRRAVQHANSSSSPSLLSSRITQSLERAQSRHNASLRNFHNNEMNHPELFQERKRLIGLAGGMEVAERARRERKRQQVDFAKRQSTTGEQGIVPLLNFCESFSRGMPDGMHADSRSLVKVSEPLDIMYVVKRGREREGKRVTRDASLPPLFSPTHQDLWERLNRHTWPDFSAPL